MAKVIEKSKQADEDDSDYTIMYVSPGPNPDRGGRTYGWAHAKDEDQRAALADQGYSDTLEDAYKKAGKPLKPYELNAGARATKPASVPAGEADRDPISGEPPAKAKPVAGRPVEDRPTLDDVKAALVALKDAKDAKAVNAVLKQFDVKAAPQLDEAQYADVIAAAQKALE